MLGRVASAANRAENRMSPIVAAVKSLATLGRGQRHCARGIGDLRRGAIHALACAPEAIAHSTTDAMPTYEYHCPKGHVFDVFQKMSDPAAAKCPECGADAERMIVPGAGFMFKGDGFYITETRSDDYKQKASLDNPGGGEASGKEKSEAKEGGAKESDSKAGEVKAAGKDAGGKKELPPSKALRGEPSSGGHK